MSCVDDEEEQEGDESEQAQDDAEVGLPALLDQFLCRQYGSLVTVEAKRPQG